MAPLAAAIYWDDDLRAQANAARTNYWHAYTTEICDQMGLTVARLKRRQLRPEALGEYTVLILPDLAGKYLTTAEKHALRTWVEAGGLLIGFATQGLGDLFGVTVEDELPQPDDPFSLVATLRYVDLALARPLLPPDEADTPLPVAAPVLLLRARGECRELARLVSLAGRDLRRPAITLRAVGQGEALFFAFDLAHSVWAMHHGRPIVTDYDGDGYYRVSDAMILRPFPTDLPYADLLLFLLREVIGRRGQPFLYPLPPVPETGAIPDALFHWGGDDEGASGQQLPASDFLHELGLPYHLNLMPDAQGRFALSREEFAQFRANGHEPSLHFNFISGREHPYPFTRQDLQEQVNWYDAAFGEKPLATVFHWTLWHGWSEPAEWLAGLGILADNSRFHRYSPPLNPVNAVGFGFGTSYPYHFHSDWRKENERLRFLGLPITAYECGYTRDCEALQTGPLQRALDLAARWHLTMNLFYHSVCLTGFPQCRAAIRWGLEYLAQRGIVALHMGQDELTRWWLARSGSCVAEVERTEEGLECEVTTTWPGGCVLQLRWESETAAATVEGEVRPGLIRDESAGRWLYVSLPAGKKRVTIRA